MISQDFVNKYGAQALGENAALGFIEQTDDFIASTITDIGTSIWNSVVSIPKLIGVDTEEYKASTYDLLRNVNEDWAAFFNQNKESVETASFFGGLVIPGMASMKGMKLLQAGKVGFYPKALSDVSQTTRVSELQKLLEAGKAGTSEFRSLRWKILAANAGQETLAAAGIELAVIAGLSDHAWMEDYMKDPVANFGISLAIGGVLGSGLGQIAVRKQLADKLGPISSEAFGKVLNKVVDIPLGASDVDKMQRYTLNARTLRDFAEDQGETQLTRDIASSFAQRWEGMAGELEQKSVFGPTIKAVGEADGRAAREQARTIMLGDEAFGANRVDFLNFEEKEFIKQRGVAGEFRSEDARMAALVKYNQIADTSKILKSSLVASEALPLLKPNWAKLMEEDFRVFYSPYHKAWIPTEEIHNYTRAVDTGRKTYEIVNVAKPHIDAAFEFAVREIPTSKSDKYWIDTLGSVAQFNLGTQRVINIVDNDLGRQNAWLSRLQSMQSEGKFLPEIRLIPNTAGDISVPELIKKGKPVTLDELEANLAQRKQNSIADLLRAGASTQEIAIRLNIPTQTIERFLLERKPLRELGQWRAYTNPGAIDTEYMSQTTRTLEFTTNGKRIASLAYRNADMSAILDGKFIKQQNKEMMTSIIAAGKSDIARQFFQVLDADIKHWEIFERQLENIVNEKSGSFFFSSGDFASRRMGDISAIAATKGQAWVGVVNNVSQERLTPLSNAIRTQTATQFGLNEFNEVINALQSISGYRDIDPLTGQLYRLVETDPGVYIREPIRHITSVMKTEIELSPSMKALLIEARKVGRELYEFKNVLNKIQGFKELNDIGLWLPTFNPVNKFISYVIDTQNPEIGGRVKLLSASTPEKLADLEQDWLSKFGGETGANKRYHLVTKSQQEDYNFWQMRLDPIEMDFSDISKFHSGASATALPTFDDTFANTMVENLHNRIIYYGRKMQELYLSDIMGQLDTMSAVNQKFTRDQPTVLRSIGLSQKEDAARSIKNMLLGNNQLDNYSTWKTVNNGFASMVEWTGRKTQEFYRSAFVEQIGKDGSVKLSKTDYVKFTKELEGVGVKNPFSSFDDYLLASEQNKTSWKLVRDDTKDELARYFRIERDGQEVAHMQLEQIGKTIYVHTVDSPGGPRSLGLSAMKEIGHLLKKEFPTANTITGERVTGVRAKVSNVDNIANQEMKDFIAGLQQRMATDVPIPDISSRTYNQRMSAAMLEDLKVKSLMRKHNISHDSAEKIIAAGNGVLATLALRVLETGQAFITAVSWPIMTLPEITRALPKTFLGNALGEGVEASFPTRAIYDGIRFRFSDAAKPLIKGWIDEGFGKPIVSEATRLNNLISTGGKGAISKINEILQGDLITKLSKPSDFMESESRLWVLSTGFQIARRMYPGISNADADLFARQFLLRSVGNYYSAQRPAMFQGTFGVAIGLFQTYMLSWAQQAYRGIEERSFKALASQMLAQAGMFGMSTLPLYDQFSKIIGANFSDKHYDLQSGTYRAIPDPLAEFVVYGLPASLGVGVYTRGDMQPRIPFTQENPLDVIAAINATRQIVGSTAHTIKKVMDANGFGDRFRGLLEGIAMQSISRPMARVVEAIPVPNGQGGFEAVGSISREGNTISTSEEIWTGPGIASRLLASRASEEQIKREVDYLNSFYGAVDYAHRKRAVEALKTSIRSGNLTDEMMTKTATEYLRTGTATGWRAALNEALATSEGGIDYKLGKRLRPDSPLQRMIDENY